MQFCVIPECRFLSQQAAFQKQTQREDWGRRPQREDTSETHVSERLRTRSTSRRKEGGGGPEQRCRISHEYERRFLFGSRRGGHVIDLFIFMGIEMEGMHQVRESAL